MSKGVINEQLIYEQSKLPLGGRREELEFFNSNGTVSGGSRCQVRIPNLRNSYLDCDNAYLRFTVSNCEITGTVLPFVDTSGASDVNTNFENLRLSAFSAASFIKEVEILNENVSIYKCDDANKIASIIQVSNTGLPGCSAKSVLDGTAISEVGALGGLKIGEAYGLPRTGSSATKCLVPEMTFCVNANVLGCLGEGCLPINQIRNGLLLQVQFETDVRIPFKADKNLATIASTGNKMSFKDISYCVPSVILDDSSQMAVAEENGFGERPTQYSGIIRRCSVLTVPKVNYNTTQTLNRLLPNNRYVSLNNILLGSFPSPDGHADGNAPVCPYNSIQYRYQGVQRPNEKIDSVSQAIQNTISCYSNCSPSVASTVMSNSHSIFNFRPSAVAVPSTSTPRMVLGVDFTAWNDDSVISGIDTSNGDTEVDLGITANASLLDFNDCFVSTFDCVWIINEGVMSCSFN